MASTDCQREGQATVEFGAKFDLSPNNEGYGRIEKISFEAYNESTCLSEAIERFRERTGYYPERVLADQIYRTRENRSIRIIPIESKWSAPSAWANVVMVWAALPQNWKKRSWLLSHYLYSWRIFSGFRGEYFTLFYICSASGMTGTDVRAASCGYLLNQQTLVRFANVTIL